MCVCVCVCVRAIAIMRAIDRRFPKGSKSKKYIPLVWLVLKLETLRWGPPPASGPGYAVGRFFVTIATEKLLYKWAAAL